MVESFHPWENVVCHTLEHVTEHRYHIQGIWKPSWQVDRLEEDAWMFKKLPFWAPLGLAPQGSQSQLESSSSPSVVGRNQELHLVILGSPIHIHIIH